MLTCIFSQQHELSSRLLLLFFLGHMNHTYQRYKQQLDGFLSVNT